MTVALSNRLAGPAGLIAVAADQVVEAIGSVSNLASGGSIGAASVTVDLYSAISINQTTADKVLTFPTPTDTSRARRLMVYNVGTAGFYAYGRLVRSGGAHEFLYVPGVGWRRTASGAQVIAQSAVAVTAPANDTNENTLATVVVPGGVMGANGALRITSLWSFTGSSNTKTPRVKFGGTTYLSQGITTAANVATQLQTTVRNRNSESSQVCNPNFAQAFAASTAPVLTGTADTSADQSVVFTGQKAAGSETLTLESYTVELLRFD